MHHAHVVFGERMSGVLVAEEMSEFLSFSRTNRMLAVHHHRQHKEEGCRIAAVV